MTNKDKALATKEEQMKFYQLKGALPNLKLVKIELNQNKENRGGDVWDKQDWLLVKLMIDIEEMFLRENEYPHFTKLRKHVLPLKLQYLKSISDEEYSEVMKLFNSLESDKYVGLEETGRFASKKMCVKKIKEELR